MADELAHWGRLNFDGVADEVDLGDVFGGLAQITIAFWVYVAATPAPTLPFQIFTKCGNNDSFDATNCFTIYYDGTFGGVLGGPNKTRNSSPVAINTLTHFAYVYDGANFTLYLNGVANTTIAATGTMNAAAGTNAIIGYTVAPTFNGFFNGWLDDVWVYSRGLSAPEVAELAARAKFGVYTDALFGSVLPPPYKPRTRVVSY